LATRLHTLLCEMHKRQAQFEPTPWHLERMHALKPKEKDQMAAQQSRVLLNKLALDEARHQAGQSQRDAGLQRMRAEELDRAAHSDALTGLLNRRFLNRQSPLLMNHAESNAQPLAAAMIDIDHFTAVNASHGHDVGDQVLTELAVLQRQATRGSDMAVRLCGEEFLVVLVETPYAGAIEAGERRRQVVQAHPCHKIAAGLSCNISIGVTAPAAGESK
jgi:diguanylate cyclase (GGDEF)-like protein